MDTIVAPLFPANLPWCNVPRDGIGGARQMSTLQRGRPLLVEFWDFCRPNSIRTLPYVKAWHERYSEHGLRVVGVHSPGFEPARDEQAVRAAVERLGVAHPVLIDSELAVWEEYGNQGWPARYLFDGSARLFDYHFGEGSYRDTELAIQELLGVRREPLDPLRPEDAPGAQLVPQSEDREGLWSGPYEAGAAWAVLDGRGTVTVNGGTAAKGGSARGGPARGGTAARGGKTIRVEHPGAYLLVEHERHTAAELDLDVGDGVRCLATCFTPGVAAEGRDPSDDGPPPISD